MDYFDFRQWPLDAQATPFEENEHVAHELRLTSSAASAQPEPQAPSTPVSPQDLAYRSAVELTPRKIGTPTGRSEDRVVVSMSTTFHADASSNNECPDLIIASSDTVYFYADEPGSGLIE